MMSPARLCPEPWVRDESLWRKFKARLTAPVEPEPKKEDDEVVEKKKVLLNGKTYECDVITKDATNYIKMRSLQQAGFMIGYDAVRKVPSITAPQCRTFVPDGDEAVQAAVDTLQESAGLEKQTIEYLLRYQWGEDLVKKFGKGDEVRRNPSVFGLDARGVFSYVRLSIYAMLMNLSNDFSAYTDR